MRKYFFFLTILILITYSYSLLGDFVVDDTTNIVSNIDVTRFFYLLQNPFGMARVIFYPVISILFGIHPLPFHVLNLIFHTGATCALFCVIRNLSNKHIAFITAALFAVHPLLSEPVSWISAGHYPQYSFFLFLTLLAFMKGLHNKKYFNYSLILTVITLSSGDKALVLPFILLLFLMIFTDSKKTWEKVIPHFVITGIWVLYYLLRLPQRMETLTVETHNPLIQIPFAITSYLRLIIWPDALTVYHTEINFTPVQGTVFTLYITALVYFFFKNKYVFFGLAFFLISLLPTLMPVNIALPVAERYVYLGSAGIFFVIAYTLHRLIKNMTVLKIIMVILITALSVRTILRTIDWHTEEQLWMATVKTSPHDINAHMNLGNSYLAKNKLDAAEREFKFATAIDPQNMIGYYSLAIAYLRQEKFDKALQLYKEIGLTYLRKNDTQKACKAFRTASLIDPQWVPPHPC